MHSYSCRLNPRLLTGSWAHDTRVVLVGTVVVLDPVVGAERDGRLVSPAGQVIHVDRPRAPSEARVARGLDPGS